MGRATFVLLILAALFALPGSTQADAGDAYWQPPVAPTQVGPMCVGYAWETWQRTQPNAATWPVPADIVYYKAQFYDMWEGEAYNGTSIEGGAIALKEYGRIADFEATRDPGHVIDFLKRVGPVVLGTPWYMGMEYPARDGYAIPSGMRFREWHAYECYDWVEGGRDGQSLGCINSEGPRWNPPYQGRFRLHSRDLITLLHAGGYAVLATKPPADPMFSPFTTRPVKR